MAVTGVKNPSSLKIKYEAGKDDSNKAIIKTKTYGSLRPVCDDTKCYDVGVAIFSVMNPDFFIRDIQRVDVTSISE